MQRPWVKMFMANANQAEGMPTARTLLVGDPGYLLGKIPGGIGMRKTVGGVFVIAAKSFEMLERNGTSRGSERACWGDEQSALHESLLAVSSAFAILTL
jgi:hypothetical protein